MSVPTRGDIHAFGNLTDSVRASDVISIQELLSAPVTSATVSDWAGDSPSRHSFLASTVWCTIRWAKELGVPRGPSFASGFTVEHDYLHYDAEDGPGGPRLVRPQWRKPSAEVVVAGSAEDATHYMTSILMHPVLLWWNRLRVELAAESWNPLPILAAAGPHSYRQVDPAEQLFTFDGSDYARPYRLHDVEVVAKELVRL